MSSEICMIGFGSLDCSSMKIVEEVEILDGLGKQLHYIYLHHRGPLDTQVAYHNAVNLRIKSPRPGLPDMWFAHPLDLAATRWLPFHRIS